MHFVPFGGRILDMDETWHIFVVYFQCGELHLTGRSFIQTNPQSAHVCMEVPIEIFI
jgi:hypothetical protein